MSNLFTKTHPDCIAFVRMVEEILEKRRYDLAIGHHRYDSKQFTREELVEMGYGGYKHLLYGRLQNVPRQYVIRDIADYLETSSEELNRLLVAARYAPAVSLLSGEELKAALNIARTVVSYWPIPAYYATRDWLIHGWNESLLRLWDITEADMAKIPLENRHILHFIFDPELPIYHRLHPLNGSRENWEYTARLNIYAFKRSNLLCQNDEWYRMRIEKLHNFPRFAQFWKEVEIDCAIDIDPMGEKLFPTYSTEITTHGRSIGVLGLQTSVGNFDYPLLIGYIPYRPVDRDAFAEIGLPTPDNGWASSIR